MKKGEMKGKKKRGKGKRGKAGTYAVQTNTPTINPKILASTPVGPSPPKIQNGILSSFSFEEVMRTCLEAVSREAMDTCG